MARLTARTPPLTGRVTLPGDKSVSHRALLIAALAAGTSQITNLNDGGDVGATATALRAFGARITSSTSSLVEVEGCGGARGMTEPDDVVDAGNSGTTLRCLVGLCAGIPGTTVLTGDASLRARPMLRVVVPLRQMGASIDGRRYGDRAPLLVRGGDLSGIELETDVASAQVKTAVLLAGLAAGGTTSVTEPRPSRDHTERMLAAAGVTVERSGTTAAIAGGQVPEARAWTVPGDLSAALFLVVGATLVPGSDLLIEDVGLNPTRAAALDVLRSMGADIEVEETTVADGEPRGRLRVRHSELHGIEVDEERSAMLIDEVPALAIAAARARGTTTFRGVGELRVKESDRIVALANGISGLGGSAVAVPDGLEVSSGALGGGRIDPAGDHRIAMAFAIAGLVASGSVTVSGWSCVDTSFPGFLETLAQAQKPR
jgi:3-phosphoshikimate 1-carboxyvinyltransferase